MRDQQEPPQKASIPAVVQQKKNTSKKVLAPQQQKMANGIVEAQVKEVTLDNKAPNSTAAAAKDQQLEQALSAYLNGSNSVIICKIYFLF